MFERVAVFGVGLIGGSFALALDRINGARRIVGVGRNSPSSRANLERALQLGVIDEIARDEEEALRGTDLVMLAAPVQQTEALLAAIQPHLTLHAIVTDAGSTKQNVVEAAQRALGGKFPQFVPGHPIAGKENSGVEAAEATLYDGKRCILTPLSDTAGHAFERVRDMWTACGAVVSSMDPAQHDRVFASVSHLPHLLAFALVAAIAREDDAAVKFAHAGGGFRDFTRIAASSPEMWRDICLANKPALLRELTAFEQEVALLRRLINDGDADAVQREFARAREIRGALRF
ncbi:prephenate dehydrogenase [Derxia gummosa]|uniref:prephenate dehydrogenase n=1 Tax=Derxia gummosa DSM 723 TaxID=1121388 RepID=A0A8B6X2T9_9BURK|nr:prephenate dehydrogenase/arogenate dehydrogenase family protein [Derxia gummosa]